MNWYVISYFDMVDIKADVRFYLASSELEAARMYLRERGPAFTQEDALSLEELQDNVFQWDAVIEVTQVPELERG